MGRKNRNRVSKDNVEPEYVSDESDNEFDEMEEQDRLYRVTDRMLEIYKFLLDFRERNGLPMMEYMSPEAFLDFTDYVTGE